MSRGGWNSVLLGEVLERVKRPVSVEPETVYRSLGVRWYAGGGFIKSEKPGAEIAATTLFGVEAGDVIYSRLFAWKGSFAVATPEQVGAVVSNEFPTYLADPERLLPEYFAVWSSRPALWAEAESISSGTAANSRFRLAEDAFEAFEIMLPSLTEQRRIVSAVDRVSRALALADRAADITRQVLIAALDELLEEHQTRPLEEVADVRGGIAKSPKPKRDPVEVPYLVPTNVQPGQIVLDQVKTMPVTQAEIERFALGDGDILIVGISGTPERLGTGWIWEGQLPEPCLYQNSLFRLITRDEALSRNFLVHALSSSRVRRQFLDAVKTTSGAGSINGREIAAVEIPVPTRSKQDAFVRVFDALKASVTQAEREAFALRSFRATLAEVLVSGERQPPALTPMAELPEAA